MLSNWPYPKFTLKAVRAEVVGDAVVGARIGPKSFTLVIECDFIDTLAWKLNRIWKLGFYHIGETPDGLLGVGPLPLAKLEGYLEQVRVLLSDRERLKLEQLDLLTQEELDCLPVRNVR